MVVAEDSGLRPGWASLGVGCCVVDRPTDISDSLAGSGRTDYLNLDIVVY